MDIQEWLSSEFFNPLHRRIFSPQVARATKEIQHFLQSSSQEQQHFQLKRLRSLCKIAATSEYYSDIFVDCGIKHPEEITLEQYHSLPLLSKDTLRNHSNAMIPQGINLTDLRQSATGGTTDSPVKIYMDMDCYYKRLASTIIHDNWLNYKPGMKMAYLWGATQDFSKKTTLKSYVKRAFLGKKLFLQSGYLNNETMMSHYHSLKKFKPTLLQAYPTPLALFSQFLLENKLTLDIPNISCTAEPLLDHQKELILNAFGRLPHNWYGSRECGRVATESTPGMGLNINGFNIYAEQLANHGNRGNIILTDLWNQGLPMLRYDTRDIGQIDDKENPSSFGYQVLNSLDGRTTDIFISPDGSYVPGVAFTNRLIKNDDHFLSLQIIQNDPAKFHVKIVPGPKYSSDSINFLTSVISEFMKSDISLSTEIVESIPAEKSGKVRFCINRISRIKTS